MNSIFPKKPVFDINYKLLNNIFPTISIEKKIFKLIYKSLENNIKNIDKKIPNNICINLQTIHLYLALDLTSYFTKLYIIERYHELKSKNEINKCDYFEDLINDKIESFPIYFKLKDKTLKRKNSFNEYLRIIHNFFFDSGFSKKIKYFINTNDNLAFTINDYLKLKSKERKFVLSNYSIFMHFDKKKFNLIKNIDYDYLIKIILSDTINIFKENLKSYNFKNNLIINDIFKKYILHCLKIESGILRNERYLSKNIYVGSLGIINNRFLSIFTKKSLKKIKLNTFDHGVGNGFIKSEIHSLVEFSNFSIFHTFNKLQKNNIINNISNSFVNLGNNTKIIEDYKQKEIITKKINKKNKSILLVMTDFKDLKVSFPPLNNDFYQLFFLSEFNKVSNLLGYDLYLKPHPSSNLNYYLNLKSPYVINQKNKFEDIAENFSILIFDFFGSSTVKYGLSTNIPIIFIDHGSLELFDNVKNLLSKRVDFLKFTKDKFNLPIIKKRLLEKSINLSLKKINNTEYRKIWY